MADLVAILEARRADYARAEAEIDTSGDAVEQSFAKLLQIVTALLAERQTAMTLADEGFLDLAPLRLEYRMIGPRPDAAPTIVMLHEGLGSVGLWGRFPDDIAAATGAGVFVYSRAGYGKSSPGTMPRPMSFMHEEACDGAAARARAIGFQRGILLGHSDGASIATIYAGSVQDHRVRGLVLIAPHFFTEEMGLAEISARTRAFAPARCAKSSSAGTPTSIARSAPGASRGSSGFPQVGHHRGARLHPRADPDRARRGRSIRHAEAGRGGGAGMLLSGRGGGAARRPPRAASAKRRELTLEAVAGFINRLLRDHHEGEKQADSGVAA